MFGLLLTWKIPGRFGAEGQPYQKADGKDELEREWNGVREGGREGPCAFENEICCELADAGENLDAGGGETPDFKG